MKIANVKGMVAKGMMAVLVAGAVMVAIPAKADAQGFGVGIEVGYPHRNFYGRNDFDRREDFRRREEFARLEAIRRHEEWARTHRFHDGFYAPYGYR